MKNSDKAFNIIFIHIGLPKTGSSFLQSAFEQIEGKNLFKNTTYPVLEFYNNFSFIQSGNGLSIARLLCQSLTKDFDKESISNELSLLVQHSDKSKNNMLISSEWFYDADFERFDFFKDLLAKHCKDIQVLCSIRTFTPWVFSLYGQSVKRHGYSGSFKEFLGTGRHLDIYKKIINFDSISVLFSYSRDNLLQRFLHVISEKSEIHDYISTRVVNRSLTSFELNLIIMLNKAFNNSKLSTYVSDRLIYDFPNNLSLGILEEDVKIANLYSAKALSLLKDELNPLAIKEIFHNEIIEAESNSSNFNNKIYQAVLTYISGYFLEKNKRFTKLYQFSNTLQKDKSAFDPIHYLIINKDVLDKGIDPRKHWELHGKKAGRYTSFTRL